MKVALCWLHIRWPWLELQGELPGKVSPEPTQTSASGPALFRVSVNDPKRRRAMLSCVNEAELRRSQQHWKYGVLKKER